MVAFTPLSLALVRSKWAEEVASPVHDALTPERRRLHLERHPRSYLGVTRSPGDGGPSSSAEPATLLAEGRRFLDGLVADGVFGEQRPPQFYAYELDNDEHRLIGLVGGVATADYGAGRVRIHERIHTERAAHLGEHLRTVGVQSSPIAMAHHPSAALAEVMADIRSRCEPLLDFATEDGVQQRVWAVGRADTMGRVSAELTAEPLYLIDGHHRAAAAWHHASTTTEPRARAMLAVVYSTDQLANRAYHRHLLRDDDVARVLDHLARTSGVRPADSRDAIDARADAEIAVYAGGSWQLATIPLRTMDGSVGSRLDNLDPVRLQGTVLGPVLGVDASAPDDRLIYRPDSTGLADLERLVDTEGGGLFCMRPTPIDLVLDASDAGAIMPPKSTYFVPKPRSGLFLRTVVS